MHICIFNSLYRRYISKEMMKNVVPGKIGYCNTWNIEFVRHNKRLRSYVRDDQIDAVRFAKYFLSRDKFVPGAYPINENRPCLFPINNNAVIPENYPYIIVSLDDLNILRW